MSVDNHPLSPLNANYIELLRLRDELADLRALLGPERCVWADADGERCTDTDHSYQHNPPQINKRGFCTNSGMSPCPHTIMSCHPYTPETLADTLRRVMGERLSDEGMELFRALVHRRLAAYLGGASGEESARLLTISIVDYDLKNARGTSAKET